MRKKIICVILTVLVLTVFGAIKINADSFMAPEPFEIWSYDETMVFRWTPDYPNLRTAQATMHRNGELIYTMENLPTMGIGEWSFFFSQDFRHFMFVPTTGFSVAMEFYTDGELIKTHYIDNFIRDMSAPMRSVTTLHWRGRFPDSRPNPEHIAEQDILRVMTRERIAYEFDLTTGAVLGYVDYNAPGESPERTNNHDIRVWLDGQQIIFADQGPVIVNGRALVPARDVFELMGFAVSWDEDTQTVTLSDVQTEIVIRVGQPYFTVTRNADIMLQVGPPYSATTRNVSTPVQIKTTIELEVPAQIINDRTLIPLRAISEAVGAEVDWAPAFSSVFINTRAS